MTIESGSGKIRKTALARGGALSRCRRLDREPRRARLNHALQNSECFSSKQSGRWPVAALDRLHVALACKQPQYFDLRFVLDSERESCTSPIPRLSRVPTYEATGLRRLSRTLSIVVTKPKTTSLTHSPTPHGEFRKSIYWTLGLALLRDQSRGAPDACQRHTKERTLETPARVHARGDSQSERGERDAA